MGGNQGTVYVERSESHYVVDREAMMRETTAAGSADVRLLEVGEVLEVIEPPKEVRIQPKLCLRARALQDNQVGWISFPTGAISVKPWRHKYVCKATMAFTHELGQESTRTGRQAVLGETFDAI